jgi:hypothetical protein
MMINNQQALVRFRLLFCGCDLMKIGPSPRSDPSPHRTAAWCAEFDSIMSLFLSTGEGKKKGSPGRRSMVCTTRSQAGLALAGDPSVVRRPFNTDLAMNHTH